MPWKYTAKEKKKTMDGFNYHPECIVAAGNFNDRVVFFDDILSGQDDWMRDERGGQEE